MRHRLSHLFTDQTENRQLSIDTNFFSNQLVIARNAAVQTQDNFVFIVCNIPYIVKGVIFGVHKLTRLKPQKYSNEYVFQIEAKSTFFNGYWVTNIFHNGEYLDNFTGIPLVLYVTKDYVAPEIQDEVIEEPLYLWKGQNRSLSNIISRLNNFTQNIDFKIRRIINELVTGIDRR